MPPRCRIWREAFGLFPGQRGWVFVRPWRFHRQHVWNGAPIGSGLGPTQYKRGLGVRVCAGACKSSLCPCGDQPVPPAGDRAVTSRLSEPPRMPKPARCGRRRLICNRRVLPRCRRCGRTTTSYDGLRLLRAVSSCARHCTYAASLGFAPCDWHFASSSIALRCSISALVAQPLRATSSARTAGHRVRMSELKISCGFRRQISSVLSTDGRTGAPVGSAAWLGVELIGQICVFPSLPRPNFREDQGARDCYKYLILVVTPAGGPEAN